MAIFLNYIHFYTLKYVSVNSFHLLCYAVECGLKCLLVKKNIPNRERSTLIPGHYNTKTHDIEDLLIRVRYAGSNSFGKTYDLPKLKIKEIPQLNGNDIQRGEAESCQYHQVFRYGIAVKNESDLHTRVIETLLKVAEWLSRELGVQIK